MIKYFSNAYCKQLVQKGVDIENALEQKVTVTIQFISKSNDSDIIESVIKNYFNSCGFFNSKEKQQICSDPQMGFF